MTEIHLILTNKLGLHARPAAEFTKVASRFKSSVSLIANGKVVDAKSILMVLTTGAKMGHEIRIKADGPDEAECIQALRELVINKFNEE